MIDPDCPCCQMLAELPGPMFWHLDGSGMDSEYAFDIFHRTLEEWDLERGRYERLEQEFRAQRKGAKLEIEFGDSQSTESNTIWSRSFSMPDAHVPLGVRLFGFGGHLG